MKTPVAGVFFFIETSELNAVAIANPAAGRGKVQSSLPSIREALARRGITTFCQTTTAGEEAILAQRAIAAGCTTIVAVGGDGTCTQIANAIVASQSSCALAVLPVGTGNDFAKTMGVSHYSADQIADLVAAGRESRIDVGVIDGRHFLNSCGFGFDASVLDASNHVKRLKGDAVYIYSALKQLFTYQGLDVSADTLGPRDAERLLMVTVSNGKFLGGAFNIAPHASVIDGALDVCFIRNSGVLARLRLFAGALRGAHLSLPSVTAGNVKEMTLTFAQAPAMELDGELRVARSRIVHLQCLPRALAVIAAPGAFSRV